MKKRGSLRNSIFLEVSALARRRHGLTSAHVLTRSSGCLSILSIVCVFVSYFHTLTFPHYSSKTLVNNRKSHKVERN
jgi:hypothetical protein